MTSVKAEHCCYRFAGRERASCTRWVQQKVCTALTAATQLSAAVTCYNCYPEPPPAKRSINGTAAPSDQASARAVKGRGRYQRFRFRFVLLPELNFNTQHIFCGG